MANKTFMAVPMDLLDKIQITRFLTIVMDKLDMAFGNKGDNRFAYLKEVQTAQSEMGATQTAGYVFNPIPLVWTKLPIFPILQSTNTDIYELNSDGTITINKDVSLVFHNALRLVASTPTTETIYFRIVDTLTEEVIYNKQADLQVSNNDTTSLNLTGLLTIGKNGLPFSPLKIRIETKSTGNYSLIGFNSVIVAQRYST